jgi:hypothetical protein
MKTHVDKRGFVSLIGETLTKLAGIIADEVMSADWEVGDTAG